MRCANSGTASTLVCRRRGTALASPPRELGPAIAATALDRAGSQRAATEGHDRVDGQAHAEQRGAVPRPDRGRRCLRPRVQAGLHDAAALEQEVAGAPVDPAHGYTHGIPACRCGIPIVFEKLCALAAPAGERVLRRIARGPLAQREIEGIASRLYGSSTRKFDLYRLKVAEEAAEREEVKRRPATAPRQRRGDADGLSPASPGAQGRPRSAGRGAGEAGTRGAWLRSFNQNPSGAWMPGGPSGGPSRGPGWDPMPKVLDEGDLGECWRWASAVREGREHAVPGHHELPAPLLGLDVRGKIEKSPDVVCPQPLRPAWTASRRRRRSERHARPARSARRRGSGTDSSRTRSAASASGSRRVAASSISSMHLE